MVEERSELRVRVAETKRSLHRTRMDLNTKEQQCKQLEVGKGMREREPRGREPEESLHGWSPSFAGSFPCVLFTDLLLLGFATPLFSPPRLSDHSSVPLSPLACPWPPHLASRERWKPLTRSMKKKHSASRNWRKMWWKSRSLSKR